MSIENRKNEWSTRQIFGTKFFGTQFVIYDHFIIFLKTKCGHVSLKYLWNLVSISSDEPCIVAQLDLLLHA